MIHLKFGKRFLWIASVSLIFGLYDYYTEDFMTIGEMCKQMTSDIFVFGVIYLIGQNDSVAKEDIST